MATAKTFEITPENTGLWHVKQSELAAKKTSELLQKDLEVSLSLWSSHTILSYGLIVLLYTKATVYSY